MGYVSKTKDPDAVLDYTWQWAEEGWLVDGDTITDATFTVYTAAGAEVPDEDTTPVVVDSSSFTDLDASVWLSGGTLGTSYLITCRVETAEGRTDDRSLKLTIKQK